MDSLPIRQLTDEDAPFFGQLNVALGKLKRLGLAVADGVVVSAPEIHLKTTLEHFDFGSREVFEQSLTLVKKELEKIPLPEVLVKECGKIKNFYLSGQSSKSLKRLWLDLLDVWLEGIKQRLWKDGFYQGITENLEPQVVIFVSRVEASGKAFFDPSLDEIMVQIKKGTAHPRDLKKVEDIVQLANKKLLIPHQYEWILDNSIKLTKILPYTPEVDVSTPEARLTARQVPEEVKKRSATKIFLDLSIGLTVQPNVDGVYISSEKIFDLNKPNDSFEELVLKLVETASTYQPLPVLCKLADISEGLPAGKAGMGKLRGAFRLIHQESLLDPLCQALIFARDKHGGGHKNIHLVIPFVRSSHELIQLKRDLAVKNLARKNSLQIWLEIATPENIINLEDYLLSSVDGVVLNLDELISHLNGFDHQIEELAFYKKAFSALIKFLPDALKLLHKSKVPFLAQGSLVLYPEVLEFLVEKGVYGVVVERFEAPSISDLLHSTEKKIITRAHL